MPELSLDQPQPASATPPFSTLTALAVVVVIISALYFGRDVLVPIALAVLLSFVLAPPVSFLQRWYFPKVGAVLVVGLVAFSLIFAFGAVMVSQVSQLAGALPSYQSTLREKIQSLRNAAGDASTLERALQILQDLGREIDKPASRQETSPSLTDGTVPARPIPVEVRQPDPGALQLVSSIIAPLVSPLTATGIVVIFVIFILLQRQDLRNRLVRLAGANDLQRTTAALDDAGQRLSHLFMTQVALNTAFGITIGVGLWLLGVPSAPLWGMLALIMRFVPYIGAMISAIFPIILAAAVGHGWTMVLATGGLFLVAETVAGQIIEPLVYGHSTGLSPVAVIASATFWTWLWGPIGLILATPLTMCVVVLGRHVDQLKFLEVMFGDQPPLTPAELIYQRMLAGDPIETAEQARVFLKEKPLAAYYDEILLEGLRLAHADADRGRLDETRQIRLRDAVAEIVDDLSTFKDVAPPVKALERNATDQSPLAKIEKLEDTGIVESLPDSWRQGTPVLCIPGLGLLDEAAALILAQLVDRRGIHAIAEKAGALSMSRIFGWKTDGVALICLCYVEYATPAQIRYAIRRVRRRAPDAKIVVALFGNVDSYESEEKSEATEFVQRSLRDAVEKIILVATLPMVAQPTPEVPVAIAS